MRNIILIFTISILLLGCSAQPSLIDKGEYRIDRSYITNNKNERVHFLVFHYTAVDDAESLNLLTKGAVSAHYLIPSQPKYQQHEPIVLQLVPEDKRAWHAGLSYWNGYININDVSIGIEIVNLGFTEKGLSIHWYPYNSHQIDLLARLSKDIIRRYNISPDNVIGHSDISPTRKFDPGPLFPWQQLAKQGIGAWPDESTVKKYLAGRPLKEKVSISRLQKTLLKYGYQIPLTGILDNETRNVISSFQMHFRPDDISGHPDAQTESIALALVEKYRS